MSPGGGENKADDMQSEFTVLEDSDSDIEMSAEDLEKDEKLLKRKEKQLNQLLEIVEVGDGFGRPLNILLIGCPGVGKSSFINTLAAALSGKWREYSYSGFHGREGKAVTVFTNSFPRCCMEEEFNENLPTLIDLAGVPDEDNDRWEELFRIILYGRLLEGESITSAYEYCDEFGVAGLRRKYVDHCEALKVDRIVFFASVTEAVPCRLIECMLRAARPSGSDRDRNTRTIPVFGVMTKIDKVTPDDTSFLKRESDFIYSLGLGGAKHRYLKCANYCDDVDKGLRVDRILPRLDIPVLRFMKQVCDPVNKVVNADERYDKKFEVDALKVKDQRDERKRTKRTKAKEGSNKFLTNALVLAVEAVLIALVLHWYLRPRFDLAYCTDISGRSVDFPSQTLVKPFLCFVLIRITSMVLMQYLPTFLKT